MRMVNSLILAFCLLVGGARSISGEMMSNEIDAYLSKMFDCAKAHNVKALEELKNKIKLKENKTLTVAYSLALYIASTKKYKQQYVETFPVDHKGIMYDLYEQIELKNLTPSFLYSIEAIGSIAEEGNEKAIEKVLYGHIHSDGVVAELFCDFLVRLFDKQSQKTLRALSRLREEQRQKNYSCFRMMELNEFSSFKENLSKAKGKATKSETKIIEEIERYQY